MRNIWPYDEIASPSVAASSTLELFRFAVPIKSKMRVTEFANYLPDAAGWTNITWIIKRNGIPLPPYHAIKDQIGYSAQLEKLAVPIEFTGGSVLSIDAVNAHAVSAFIVGMRIKFELYED